MKKEHTEIKKKLNELEKAETLNTRNISLNIKSFLSRKSVYNSESFSMLKKKSIWTSLLKDYHKERKAAQAEILSGKSFGLFKGSNCFRKTLFGIYSSNIYILLLNLISILTPFFLALYNTNSPSDEGLNFFINIFVFSSGWVFVAESVLEMIVLGVFKNGPKSYLRDPLCSFELLLNIGFIMGNFEYFQTLKVVIAFRVARVFLVIKRVTKNDKIALVMNSLIESLPEILKLVFVEFLFFFLLSVLNVNILKGTFYTCDTQNVPLELRNLVNTRKDCIDLGGDWINAVLSFDHIASSMMLIFQMVTAEGWTLVMFQAMDSKGVNLQSEMNSNFYISFYFIFLIIVANFLILNFFAGVVIETFSKEKAKKGGYFLLSKSQRKWIDIHTIVLKFSPKARFKSPKSKWRRKLFVFVQKKSFRVIEFFLIILSCFPYFLIFHNASSSYRSFIDTLTLITFFIFLLEFTFKLVAVGFQNFKKFSIQFDFSIILLELLMMLLAAVWPEFTSNFPTLYRVLKSLRIIRLAKIMKYVKGNSVILDIYKIAWPMLLNIMIMLTCLIFVYSVIGMHLFPYMKWRKGINSNANFTTFPLAFLTLLRMSTVEGWDTLLRDCLKINRPNDICYKMEIFEDFEKRGKEYLGCGNNYTYFYFLTFMIVFVYLLTNLITAIIIETFVLRTKIAKTKVNMKELKRFVKIWRRYDKDGNGMLHWKRAKKVIEELRPPLGVRKEDQSKSVMKYLMKKIKVPLWKKREDGGLNLYFYDLLLALVKNSLKGEEEFADLDKVKVKIHDDLYTVKKIKQKNLEKGFLRIPFTSRDLELFFPVQKKIIERLAGRNHNFKYLVNKAEDLDMISEHSSIISESSEEDIFEEKEIKKKIENKARRGVIFIPNVDLTKLNIPPEIENQESEVSVRSKVSSISSDSDSGSFDSAFERKLQEIEDKKKKNAEFENKKKESVVNLFSPRKKDEEIINRLKDDTVPLTERNEKEEILKDKVEVKKKDETLNTDRQDVYINNDNVLEFQKLLLEKKQEKKEIDNELHESIELEASEDSSIINEKVKDEWDFSKIEDSYKKKPDSPLIRVNKTLDPNPYLFNSYEKLSSFDTVKLKKNWSHREKGTEKIMTQTGPISKNKLLQNPISVRVVNPYKNFITYDPKKGTTEIKKSRRKSRVDSYSLDVLKSGMEAGNREKIFKIRSRRIDHFKQFQQEEDDSSVDDYLPVENKGSIIDIEYMENEVKKNSEIM